MIAPLMGTAVGSDAPSGEEPPQVDYHRVKVGFSTAIPTDIHARVAELGGVVALRSDILKFVAVQLPETVDGDQVLAEMRMWEDVLWALYDGFAHTMTVRDPLVPNPPTDPLYTSQYGPQLIGGPAAWSEERGRDGIILAILDTGVDVTHPDLTNACVAHCAQAPYDVYGHGTHVAGIAAAEANNGVGIAGVAQVDLMAVKALTDAGTTWWTHIAVAVVDAAVAGADVISMSLGGNCNFNGILLCPELDQAIQLAWSLGVVIVASSGNNGSPTVVSHPAVFNNVVAVGSVGSTKVRSGFSNGGAGLDVMAPGEFVLSSVPKESVMCGLRLDPYCAVSGTSMSAPHVAGVAALILSHCPTTTNADVVSLLQSTAEDRGAAGWDNLYGYGLVRADLAVSAAPVC